MGYSNHHRGKNLIGDLRDDGVTQRLQSGASVWDSSGDSWDMVWFGVEMSVHVSGYPISHSTQSGERLPDGSIVATSSFGR